MLFEITEENLLRRHTGSFLKFEMLTRRRVWKVWPISLSLAPTLPIASHVQIRHSASFHSITISEWPLKHPARSRHPSFRSPFSSRQSNFSFAVDTCKLFTEWFRLSTSKSMFSSISYILQMSPSSSSDNFISSLSIVRTSSRAVGNVATQHTCNLHVNALACEVSTYM